MQPMANWLASELPVADAVSFEFDGISVTAQHVMAETAPLMATCLPFATSSSKTIVKFRRTDVFMRGHVSEKWDTNGSWSSAPQLVAKQRHWWRGDDGISTADAANNWDGHASVTLPLIDIYHPSRRLILKTTREILNIQLKHCSN